MLWIKVLYQICDLPIFSPSLCLSYSLTNILQRAVFNIGKIQFVNFFSKDCFCFLSKNSSTKLRSHRFFPIFSSTSFIVLQFIHPDPWLILNCVLFKVYDMCLCSCFCLYASFVVALFVQKAIFPPFSYFYTLVKMLIVFVWVYFWAINSIWLIYMTVPLPIPCHHGYYNYIVNLKIVYSLFCLFSRLF